LEEAAPIALQTVIGFLAGRHGSIQLVRFVLYGRRAYQVYADTLTELIGLDGEVT
jgi:O-acetyl-ADP-ribose deacetylase (regulator of RNase III)